MIKNTKLQEKKIIKLNLKTKNLLVILWRDGGEATGVTANTVPVTPLRPPTQHRVIVRLAADTVPVTPLRPPTHSIEL